MDLAGSVAHLQVLCADPEELVETKGLALLSFGMIASNGKPVAIADSKFRIVIDVFLFSPQTSCGPSSSRLIFFGGC